MTKDVSNFGKDEKGMCRVIGLPCNVCNCRTCNLMLAQMIGMKFDQFDQIKDAIRSLAPVKEGEE